MAALSVLLGAAAAWLLLLGASAAVGLALASTWPKWGHKVPLPPAARRLLATWVAQPGQTTTTPAAAQTHTSSIVGSMDLGDSAPAQVADEVPLDAAEALEPLAPPEPDDEPERPIPRMPRAEAIEELTTVFGASYEAAVALLNSGLWGLDNHDEWSRAVRAGQMPAGVDPDVVKRVLARGGDELAHEREQIRERRAALDALEQLAGMSADDARRLYDAGFTTPAALRETSTEKLAKIEGLGPARAFQIRAAAHGLAATP